MRQRVYIETTIVSYLTAKPSRDLILVANQELTREWWDGRRHLYDLYTSQFVLDEAAKGDAVAAGERRRALQGVSVVGPVEAAIALAEEMLRQGHLPPKAATDALHLATAAVHHMDVLLTWNCRHLANASILVRLYRFLRARGQEPPLVCTPIEMMGGSGRLGD